jgi:hypothetical protein
MAGANMSQLATGIFGAIAVSLSLGAVQFAAGRDLSGTAGTQDPLPTSEAVNRAAKTDRADGAAGPAQTSRTIALRLDALADTSVLIRVPVAKEIAKETGKEARNGPSAPLLTKSADRKIACEPVVSVLTEVAKRLQPGRCIT